MANTYQDSPSYRSSRRYTIPQLLQLAHDRKPFDLSKFSYDAARAGVVPPLGDCAMSSRRSSNNRPRGWSSASFETSDDIVVFGGNINSGNVIKPDRQPMNPPPEIHAEKDMGFAKFLKKHSSPTHNRVTAGGRIVPMEKRESPPKFNLPASAQLAGEAEIQLKQELTNLSHLKGQVDHQGQTPHYLNTVLVSTTSVKQEPSDEVNAESEPIADGIQRTAASFQSASHTINSTSTAPQTNPGSCLNVSLPELQSQNGVNYFSPQLPYLPIQSPTLYTGYAWPTTDVYNMALLNVANNFNPYLQAQMMFSAKQMVLDAEALFHNLDRQLKLIDRHRAMNSHDPSLSAQRMVIVQQRAEAKEMMDRLKNQQQQPQSQGRPSFAAGMPPAFVPAVMASVQPPVGSPASTSTTTIKPQLAGEKSHPAAKRKPIPIVPPPPSSPAQAEPCKKHNASPIAKPLKKGEDTQHSSQSDDAQLSHDDDNTQSSSSKTSATPQPEVVSQQSQPVEPRMKDKSKQAQSKAKLDQTEWIRMQTGETPSEVEAIYELQLDAMRLPECIKVYIPLSNGSRVCVPGSKLGRPSLSLISEFEKEYWDRKPTFTIEMLQNLRARAELKNIGPVLTDDYLVADADGPPASPIKELCNSEMKHDERVQRYVDDQSECLQDYALSHFSTKSELSVAYEANGQGSPLATAGMMVTSITKGQPAEDTFRSDTESMVFDEMSQKGYSSVSFQNISVQVQLPPPGFDGATEPNRRSAAVSSLSAAGKQRSPRIVHRSSPNGGA